jgi:chemotaxis protein histidine kinase CheA
MMMEMDRFQATIDKIHSFKTGEKQNQEEYVLVASLTKAADKASTDLNKKVKLIIDGIDREAMENGPRRVIKEVLTQLVRNAVYHGIEGTEERKAAGKDEVGVISLSIKTEGGRIHIKMNDDGKGLDLERIREKAEKLGLLDGEKLSDRNSLLKVIFAPGFSTAENEGLHAGRGMGLNLVHDRIRELKGNIRLNTDPGKGTTFHFYIPFEESAVVNKAS